MLEVGREKVKIGDEQNGEALRNIDPKQPFHGMGLTASNYTSQELELISHSRCHIERSATAKCKPWGQAFEHLWSISLCIDPEFNLRLKALASRTSSAALQLRFTQNDR